MSPILCSCLLSWIPCYMLNTGINGLFFFTGLLQTWTAVAYFDQRFARFTIRTQFNCRNWYAAGPPKKDFVKHQAFIQIVASNSTNKISMSSWSYEYWTCITNPIKLSQCGLNVHNINWWFCDVKKSFDLLCQLQPKSLLLYLKQVASWLGFDLLRGPSLAPF